VTRQRTILITAGVMMSLFLASMESTVISTAMPTIVGQLGGLEHYAWVFSIYMLSSTTTGPIYGKLSDIYGRRPVYMVALGLFVFGSLLCGLANSMWQLIAARAVQGLGAGGLLPLAFIIVGDIFTLEQRTKVQGLFSGVWGVSSVIGPLVGGFFVDRVSWHWIFYVNVPFALLAATLVWIGWSGVPRPTARPVIDYAGAVLLCLGTGMLLLGLNDISNPQNWALLGGAAVALATLLWVESRAASPILPLPLFRDRMFAVASAHGMLAAFALFGMMSYVPLFVQGVLGTSATAAGSTLTPLLLGWVGASIIGSRLLLRFSSRSLAITGMVGYLLGAILMAQINIDTPLPLLMAGLGLMGAGMGLSIPSFLIAVQSSVQKQVLGAATATVQFARNIGGTLGVSIMGAMLSAGFAKALVANGLDPATASLNGLLGGEGAAASQTPALSDGLRIALASAIHDTFSIALVVAVIVLGVTLLTPGGKLTQFARKRSEGTATAD
jgi:EmrB/QacA subfamily drug resistance transporter